MKSIGNRAFYNLKGITSISFGNELESVGNSAFEGCSGLTSISIPNTLRTIGEKAFYNLKCIESLSLDNIETIGTSAFYNNALKSVILGPKAKSVGTDAFRNCSGLLKSAYPNTISNPFGYGITVAYNNDDIYNDGFIYGPGQEEIIFAPYYIDGEYSIDGCVSTIADKAFAHCKNMTSVVIPESVSSIGSQAFLGCSALTSVKSFNQNPPVMNDNSFEGRYALATLNLSTEASSRYLATNWSLFENLGSMSGNVFGTYETGNLKYRLIPAPTEDDENLAIVIPGDYVSLTEVTIPQRITVTENGKNVRYFIDGIGYKAFNSGSNLTTVTFNSRNASKTIGEYAFAGTKISAINIPQSVETIHDYAFSNCSALENVEIGSEAKTIGNYAFNKCKSLHAIHIPDKIVRIGDYAFSDCTALKDVEIGSGVKTIGDFAFNNCSAFESIAIPSPVETIGNGAFNSCTSLSNITVSESVKKIGDKAFFETKATKVALSEGLEYIGALAFSANAERNANPIYIPATLQSVGKDAFFNYNCDHVNISDLAAWCNIDFENENANPAAYRNGLYLNDEIIEDLIIPTSAGTVKDYAFYRNSSLKSVSISKDVQSIGTNAFYGDSNLRSIVISGSVLSIGRYAFGNCAASPVVSFEYGSMPVEIGLNAFEAPSSLAWDRPMDGFNLNVSSLKSLAIGNSLTEISDAAFKGISSLTALKLGNSLSAIGDEAFSGCTGLTEVILPPSVETIGASAFAGDTQLTSIIMGHKVTTIGEKAFDLCPAQTVSITAQTPPDAPDNTFSNYTGNLYVQGEDAAEAYYDADFCWFQFEGLVMIEPTDLIVDGDTKISGKPGDTFQLTAKLYPENVTLPHIFWRSTNPDIASVDHNGLVTLHANLDDVMAAAELYDDVSPTTSCKIIGESLYANGPKIELEVNQEGDNSSNLDEIFGSGNNGKIDYTAPVEVYNLSGVRVADSVENLANGIYIIRQGSKVEKIAIK
ncbi:MAG: leucine-rich repeat protein [Candidatus Limisoma sp.]|nr:leucine-rich repeat protein [Candidatus Limisoma sp.]